MHHLYIFTARKRSGKVMFLHLSVILFTGGGLCPGGVRLLSRRSLSRGVSVKGGTAEYNLPAISVQGGVSVWGGLCQADPSPYGNELAVRILLECIFVKMLFYLYSLGMLDYHSCIVFPLCTIFPSC